MTKTFFNDDDPGLASFQDQDLRVFKAITSDSRLALDFVNSHDPSVFLGDSKHVGKAIFDYIKAYKTTPTKRVLVDKYKTDTDLAIKIENLFDILPSIDFDPNEYQYDLDKIKHNYAETKFNALKDDLRFHDKGGLDQTMSKMEETLQEIKRIRQPAKRSYTQKSIDEFLPEFHEEYVAKVANPLLGRGVLSGYSYLDYVTNGMQPAEMLIIGGETSSGKMVPLNTSIPTPIGFIQMNDIHTDSLIIGRDGKPYKVVAESDIVTSVGWKFTFSDGTEIISHPNHEWLTFDRKEQIALHKNTEEFRTKRKNNRSSRSIKNTKPWLTQSNKNRKYQLTTSPTGTIRTTQQIVETLKTKNGRNNHAIPICEPLDLPHKNLLIDPYIFGCWLGDGSKDDGAITSMDQEIVRYFESKYPIRRFDTKTYKTGITSKASTYYFNNLRNHLKIIGVLNNKHIPNDYLWASKEQRLALLQGLMDTDGCAYKNGTTDFVNTNKKIIDGIVFLINSLGEQCIVTEGEAKLYGRVTGTKWTVRFSPSFETFCLTRKLERQKITLSKIGRKNKLRYIVKAERTSAVPMKCIQVDSPDHLYLCGEQLIPTHNSMFLNNIAVQMWMQKNTLSTEPGQYIGGCNILYFSLEMPYKACFKRTLARLADIPMYGLRDSRLTKAETESLNLASRFIKKFSEKGPKFEIVDIPRGVNTAQIEERYLEAKSKFNPIYPIVVFIDYLGLMEDDTVDGDDWLKLGKIAGKVHEFGRTYNVPVCTAVQLNRPAKSKQPEPGENIGVHRIGRSSLIMHHANIGIQIETRKDEWLRDTFLYHLIKNRDGELGKHEISKKFANASIFDIPYVAPDRDDYGSYMSGFNDEDDISGQVRTMLGLT